MVEPEQQSRGAGVCDVSLRVVVHPLGTAQRPHMVRFVYYLRARGGTLRPGLTRGCQRPRGPRRAVRAGTMRKAFHVIRRLLNRKEGKLGFSLVNRSAPYRKREHRMITRAPSRPRRTSFVCTSRRRGCRLVTRVRDTKELSLRKAIHLTFRVVFLRLHMVYDSLSKGRTRAQSPE